MRRDLSPTQIVVQSAHAAIESSRQHIPVNLEHPHIVLLGIRNELELHKALVRVQSSGLKVCSFYEPDRNNELTAFATQPVTQEYRSFFKRYNCLSDDLLFSGFL